MAVSSASRGREARKSAYLWPLFCGAAARWCGSSACTISRPSNPAISARDRASCSWSSSGNSSTPEGDRNALKPKTPVSCSGRRSLTLPGRAPPQKPTSMCALERATSFLMRRWSTVVVGGRELRGMSTRVVMPPAAAARVAVQKPSHSVRPGSLTCTWVSTRPGSRTSSPKSSSRAPAGTSASCASTAVIFPPETATEAARVPSGVITRVERRTNSPHPSSDTRTPLHAARLSTRHMSLCRPLPSAVYFHVTEFNVLLKESSLPAPCRQESTSPLTASGEFPGRFHKAELHFHHAERNHTEPCSQPTAG